MTQNKMSKNSNLKMSTESKSVKLTPKERISAKNELFSLAIKLQKNKKISTTLYNKIEKILSQTKPQMKTITTTLEMLNNIEKDSALKKVSVKQYTEIQKTKAIEAETIYNVYVKMEVALEKSIEDQKKNKSIIQLNINDNIYYVLWTVQNHTLIIQGKDNIKDKIKELIKFQMGKPYGIKIKIKHVIVNKQLTTSSVYRWKGAQKTENQIKYFRAWDASSCFKHHGLNLDKNDETEYQCIPNAFLKMYGDRKQKGFIARIANGGIEYIKSKLDSYDEQHDDTFDLDFGIINTNGQKGYNSDHILKFCNEHKIRCYGYTWKNNLFITNKYDNIKFNNDNLPAFVFQLNDQHVYLINDLSIRQRLLHLHNNSDIFSILARKRER